MKDSIQQQEKLDPQYEGRCFCGAVRFSLKAGPEAMAYCHCDSCRHWSAGPLNAFTLWNPDHLRIIRGQQYISSFDQNPSSGNDAVLSIRRWCKKCGGHVFTEHPGMELVDVPAVVIRGLDFKPSFHVHYQESVFAVEDGLPKFKDLPIEAGGSGIELSEV